MSGYSVSSGKDRIISGQPDIIFMPREGARGRRGVILMHGQLQVPQNYYQANPSSESGTNGQTFQTDLAVAMAATGLTIVAIHSFTAANGPNWGNDASIADMDTARTFLGTLGCATDKVLLVGASAGAAYCWNYTRANPTKVAAIATVIPACDLERARNDNPVNARHYIDLAWGLTDGSTQTTEPLPARANPVNDANAALIASSGAAIKMYYSTADTIIPHDTVETLAAKLGITPTIISTTIDHSDQSFSVVPLQEMCQMLDAHA